MSCLYDFASTSMKIGEDGFVQPRSTLDRPPAPVDQGHSGMWRDWSAAVRAQCGGEPIVVPELQALLRSGLVSDPERLIATSKM
eukprot:COSAG01_NODE_18436_length_1076_cov_1.357216_1_plen_84_part_00